MLSEHAVLLDEIFVGRKQELKILNALWKRTLLPDKHLVYVLLNAPGTGKTRLLKFFGEQLEHDNEGLYFRYVCDNRHLTSSSLHRHLLEEIRELVYSRTIYIKNYIIKTYSHDDERQYRMTRFSEILQRMNASLGQGTIVTLDDVVSVFHQLSQVIPIFFVADEIQEFQKLTIEVDEPSLKKENSREETALHYFTRILKSLMSSRILMVLSGTQFHILSQIGTKIGSPIAQKVEQIVIKNFSVQETNEYVQQVQKRILQNITPSDKKKTAFRLVEFYRQFLLAFSGGHPRTVVMITQWFLANYHDYLERNPSHGQFTESLFDQVEKDFKHRIFTSEKQEQVRRLQTNEYFNIVKNWLQKNAVKGFDLGTEPTFSSSEVQKNVLDLVYQLMTLGVIVQNGINKFHVTSYFHLLAFVECFT